MEKNVNIRGKLNAMQVNDTVALPRCQCVPSTVRHTAAILRNDTGKSYTVSAPHGSKVITVTRLK